MVSSPSRTPDEPHVTLAPRSLPYTSLAITAETAPHAASQQYWAA